MQEDTKKTGKLPDNRIIFRKL